MTEELEVAQLTQLQKDTQCYNMGYRQAYQAALAVEDMEAKNTGFQLGYILMNPPAKREGCNWVVESLGLKVEGRKDELTSSKATIGLILERIRLETDQVKEPVKMRKVLSSHLTSQITPQDCSARMTHNLTECKKELETGASALSPI
eukprot:TRINITY_DN5959_c0_g1_i1.p2 TRINITY_DN5959_c0_g1~~TRINITY_DN5959_c0_g1_i1.p2  ORF type:complete len:148 (+),score=29.01 TRINITY_DN5959_c0_g1_i1:758-1201(+)